jgi:hypothetical protein
LLVLLADATWPEIERLRAMVAPPTARSLEQAAQHYTRLFTSEFPSVILSRLFVVLPYEALPVEERTWAVERVGHDARLLPATRVLCLLATQGREAAWNDRCRSVDHRAIPLLDRQFVQDAPMVAKLLADLQVDLAMLDDGRLGSTRLMPGGLNGTFYVEDAQTALDAKRRPIIASQDFVKAWGVRTVFGMGGVYVDGTLVISIVFSTETLDRLTVDRFPSLISNFKMATADLVATPRIFRATDAAE